MNVFLLMIDSLSFEYFGRVFPKTFKYLNSEFEHNVLFKQVNRVGEKTYPNFLAFMSGIIEETTDNEFSVYRNIDSLFYDVVPLQWKNYQNLGYLTGYYQEHPIIGPFHYMKKGFR